MKRYWTKKTLAFATVLAVGVGSAVAAQFNFIKEYKSGIVWPEPQVIDPGPVGGPPSDATVLFDGTDLSQWHGGDKWEIQDGYAIAKGGGITTKEEFGDCQVHLEWAAPEKVEGHGQGRGNSGIYLMNKYEIQILDSYENETYYDGQAGALYKQRPPMVNACRKPGEWQTYDILFKAPRFDENKKLIEPGSVTVLHNGVVIHNHTEIQGSTAWHRPPEYEHHPPKGPLHLQFHGNPVRFRNIWVRKIQEIEGKKPEKSEKSETEDSQTSDDSE